MKEKMRFNERVIKEHPDSLIATILDENKNCDYYELCQSFLDISLNAIPFQDERGNIKASFQRTDIEIAKQKAIAFIKNNSIADLDQFFECLEDDYPYSSCSDDTRPKTSFIKEKNCNYKGYIGTILNLTRIDEQIFRKIILEIKELL